MLLRITTVLLTTLGAYIPLGLMTGYRDYKGPAKHPPKEYLARGRQPSTRVLVVSAGDSLTQGTFSADYVGLLRTKLNGKGYEFVNAGVNGEKSQELLARVQEIIACKPDVITILIGTNDVHDLIRTNIHDPSNPRASLALYRRNLEQIILQIQSETQARVAVLSIPPLGEDLESPANIILRRYNDSVREICAGRQVAYLLAYESLSEVIQQSQRTRAAQHSDQPGNLSAKVAVRHYFLRQNWDQISQISGFAVHTDGIHLNSRGAAILAGLIEQWMTQQALPSDRAGIKEFNSI